MRETSPAPPIGHLLAELRPVGKVREGKGPSRRSVQRKPGKRNRPAERSFRVIVADRKWRQLIGVTASILFHLGLLIYSATWLMQRAQVHVERGETSTTITLTLSAPPQPAPPTPSPPTPAPVTPPVKPITPTVVPVVIQSQAVPVLQPIAITHPPAIIHSKSPPTPTVAKPKTAPSTRTTSASHGATQAQPDDLHNEPPEYPEESQRAREQGVVILKVEVTATGEPLQVSVLQSSGFPRLDQAARQAVRHWRFHPAIGAGGQPVASEADVPVRFKLENVAY